MYLKKIALLLTMICCSYCSFFVSYILHCMQPYYSLPLPPHLFQTKRSPPYCVSVLLCAAARLDITKVHTTCAEQPQANQKIALLPPAGCYSPNKSFVVTCFHPNLKIKDKHISIQHTKIAYTLQQSFTAILQHCKFTAKCCCGIAATLKCPPLEILH